MYIINKDENIHRYAVRGGNYREKKRDRERKKESGKGRLKKDIGRDII